MQDENISVTRRRWMYATAAAVAAVGGAGLAWRKHRPGPADDGVVASLWQLSFDTPDGGRLTMQSLQGRPLLINFWATWCPPCVEELPLLNAFYRENVDKGWQVLGLAVDKVGAVRDFLTRQPLAFPVALAGTEGVALSKSLGNLSGGLPFSVLIGADGQLRNRKIGKMSKADLAQWQELK